MPDEIINITPEGAQQQTIFVVSAVISGMSQLLLIIHRCECSTRQFSSDIPEPDRKWVMSDKFRHKSWTYGVVLCGDHARFGDRRRFYLISHLHHGLHFRLKNRRTHWEKMFVGWNWVCVIQTFHDFFFWTIFVRDLEKFSENLIFLTSNFF